MANAPLLRRVISFVALFVLASGLIGPRVISHGLVGSYGFGIYGWAGKAVLFGVISFLLLTYKRLGAIRTKPWRKANVLWLLAAAIAFVLGWDSVNHLIAHENTLHWAILTHVAILSVIACVAFGCITTATIHSIIREFKRELLISLLLAAMFTVFLSGAYALWLPLSTTVLHAVQWLLHLIGIQAGTVPPDTLVLSKFGIMVSKYCSGVDSIALFTGLYIVVALMDWKKLNHRRFVGIFLPALALLFACNILRVFVLIVAGYYINPQIAFSLFHTYAGMLFFIVYSAIFWKFAYSWMIVRSMSAINESEKDL